MSDAVGVLPTEGGRVVEASRMNEAPRIRDELGCLKPSPLRSEGYLHPKLGKDGPTNKEN